MVLIVCCKNTHCSVIFCSSRSTVLWRCTYLDSITVVCERNSVCIVLGTVLWGW